MNALRAEHNERKQQEAIERERQRQLQLAQKLDFMRQKKQVSFLYSNSLLFWFQRKQNNANIKEIENHIHFYFNC